MIGFQTEISSRLVASEQIYWDENSQKLSACVKVTQSNSTIGDF